MDDGQDRRTADAAGVVNRVMAGDPDDLAGSFTQISRYKDGSYGACIRVFALEPTDEGMREATRIALACEDAIYNGLRAARETRRRSPATHP